MAGYRLRWSNNWPSDVSGTRCWIIASIKSQVRNFGKEERKKAAEHVPPQINADKVTRNVT